MFTGLEYSKYLASSINRGEWRALVGNSLIRGGGKTSTWIHSDSMNEVEKTML